MAPPLPWLPEDVIAEILSRTPVKSVCRFRCVSKGWHALISDPAFAATHRCPDNLLVAHSSLERTGMAETRVMDMDGNTLRAIDGLDIYWNLLAALDNSLYVDTSSGQVVDLATGQVLVACPPELSKRIRSLFTIGRVAAPSYAYKVVRVTNSPPPHTCCMVLTLGEEDAKWRPVPPPRNGASIRYSPRSVVTLNGVVYFLPAGKDTPPHPQEVDDDDNGVLCFDLESETWKETIKGPPVAAKPSNITAAASTRITNLNDTLCMVVTRFKVHGDWPHTDVWILSDHGGGGAGGGGGGGGTSWTHTYSIPIGPPARLIMPLGVMTHGGREQLLFFCHIDWDIAVPVLRFYDPVGETYTDIVTKLSRNFHFFGLCTLYFKHVVQNSILPRTPASSTRGTLSGEMEVD